MRSTSTRMGLVMLLTLVLSPVLAQAPSERLVVGEQKTFKPGYAVGDIAISNPAVCDFRVVSGRREVMLIANGQGFATLTVWDQRGVKRDELAIEVLSREFAKTLADLTELLQPYPDVSIRPLGNRAAITGTVNTPEELQNVRALAGATGAVCTVTVKAGPAAAAPPGSPTAVTPAPTQPPPALPSVVRDPEPPPTIKRAPAQIQTPAPVPLGGATPPVAVPVPVKPEATAAPATPPEAVSVPATATPPPPNVSIAQPELQPKAPATPPATPAWNPPAGAGSFEYLVELYETPVTAPPPEVAGLQGKKLYGGRLRTDPGIEVRHLIQIAPAGEGSPQRGFSIGLVPSLVGAGIQTVLTVDTNLPFGAYDQAKTPVWIRATTTFTNRSGQTRYVLEAELAKTAKPAMGMAQPAPAPGAASKVGGYVLDAGASAAGLPSPQARGGSAQGPRPRSGQFVLAITPMLVRPGAGPTPAAPEEGR